MDNLERLSTLGTRDTGKRQANKTKPKTKNKQNTKAKKATRTPPKTGS